MDREHWRKILRWRIARDTGWSLSEVDAMTMGDVWEYLSVLDGEAKVLEHRKPRGRRKGR